MKRFLEILNFIDTIQLEIEFNIRVMPEDRPKTSNKRINTANTTEYSPLALQTRFKSPLETIEEEDEYSAEDNFLDKPKSNISDIDSNASTQASFNKIQDENLEKQAYNINLLNKKRPSLQKVQEDAREILTKQQTISDNAGKHQIGYKKLNFSNTRNMTPPAIAQNRTQNLTIQK